ncbi:MAG: hypothetical protein EHM35_00750 [Planctomycetaceae bacterium]|nr:MAG: hypothetical protein EHM35_00750 [Planctomycetaceae bacterium]
MKSSRRSFLSALLGLPVAAKAILAARPRPAKVPILPEPASPVYVGLFDDREREVSGHGYARVPAGGPDEQIEFPQATGAWGTVTQMAFCDGPFGPPLWFIRFDCYGDVDEGNIVRVTVHPSC